MKFLLMILKKAEGNPRLRKSVAESAVKHNYNSPLKILSKDQYECIRMVVAEGATDESILREMLADQSNSNKMKQTIKNKLKSINVNIEK